MIAKIYGSFERIGPPGLNSVLKYYEATHGHNELKDIFKNVPEDFFHVRPLPLEWVIYSASDVEDLIEVKELMIDSVFKNL